MSNKASPREEVTSSKPSEKFRKAMRQILSVPKEELARREADYQKQRTLKKQTSKDG